MPDIVKWFFSQFGFQQIAEALKPIRDLQAVFEDGRVEPHEIAPMFRAIGAQFILAANLVDSLIPPAT